MSRGCIKVFRVIAASVIVAPVVAQINTLPGGPPPPFWTSGWDRWGQSFTAPSDPLNSFGFYFSADSPFDLTASIWELSGSTVGVQIWGGSVRTVSGEGWQDFNTGSLSLGAGSQYLAAMIPAITGDGSHWGHLGYGPTVYAGGSLFLAMDGFGGGAWQDTGSLDGSFRAEFGANSTVPEPATMTLLATGLVGLVGAGMRRRKKA